jgi:uncharacterized OsmC-like protein
MPTMVSENKLNGVALDVLKETVSAIQKDPGLPQCKLRAHNRWIEGTQNCTSISDYYAAREEQRHQQPFELAVDEPPLLAGSDQAPGPVEYLLNALAGCITTSMVAHAAVRGIKIEELESVVEGDIDLRGFLGLANEVPKGFTNIRARFKVKTDAPNLERLKQLAEFSPVYNTISRGARVDIQVEPR